MQRSGYYGSYLNGYRHGKGSFIQQDVEFQGFWDKGLRVNQGIYKTSLFTLRCRFRNGRIYKILEFLTDVSDKKTISTSLMQPAYLQEGGYYTEIPSSEKCFFTIEDKRFLFDGFPAKSKQFLYRELDGCELLGISDDRISIHELRLKNYLYIGRLVHFVPIGPAKIIIKDKFYIKGVIRGYFFTGKCKIVKENSKILINLDNMLNLSSLELSLKTQDSEMELESKERLSLTSLKKISNINTYNKKMIITDEVFNKCIDFIFQIEKLCKKHSSIAYSVMVRTNWLDLENEIFKYIKDKRLFMKKINSAEKFLNNFEGLGNYDYEKVERDKKRMIRKRFDRKSFFYGEVKDGLRHGLGSFVFSDGSRFKGYFENGNICGIGYFENSEYRIKGLWKDNRILKVMSFVLV